MTHLILGEVNCSLGFGLTSLSLSLSHSLPLSTFILTTNQSGITQRYMAKLSLLNQGFGTKTHSFQESYLLTSTRELWTIHSLQWQYTWGICCVRWIFWSCRRKSSCLWGGDGSSWQEVGGHSFKGFTQSFMCCSCEVMRVYRICANTHFTSGHFRFAMKPVWEEYFSRLTLLTVICISQTVTLIFFSIGHNTCWKNTLWKTNAMS